MKNVYFEKLERASSLTSLNVNEIIEYLAFNEQGLIPVITQEANTKNVLMLAWMNKVALKLALSGKRVTYWSRGRKQLWTKGETSGHTQSLVSMAFDCDGDSVLCQVIQSGAACHTGRPNCFYLNVDTEKRQLIISGGPS